MSAHADHAGRRRFPALGHIQIRRHGKIGPALEDHLFDFVGIALDHPGDARVERRFFRPRSEALLDLPAHFPHVVRRILPGIKRVPALVRKSLPLRAPARRNTPEPCLGNDSAVQGPGPPRNRLSLRRRWPFRYPRRQTKSPATVRPPSFSNPRREREWSDRGLVMFSDEREIGYPWCPGSWDNDSALWPKVVTHNPTRAMNL